MLCAETLQKPVVEAAFSQYEGFPSVPRLVEDD
jgi:hypothetical protein